MSSMTLFEIGDDIRALQDILQEAEGDISDEALEATIDQWLTENEEHLDTKLDGYCSLIKEREAIAKARKEEEARIKALRSTDENFATRLKKRLELFFGTHKIERKETTRFKLWIQNSGGVMPLWFNENEYSGDDVEDLPPSYQKTLVVPNMELIREDANELFNLETEYTALFNTEGVTQAELDAWGAEFGGRLTSLRDKLRWSEQCDKPGIAKMLPRGTHLRIK